jgi:hypothetical protein
MNMSRTRNNTIFERFIADLGKWDQSDDPDCKLLCEEIKKYDPTKISPQEMWEAIVELCKDKIYKDNMRKDHSQSKKIGHDPLIDLFFQAIVEFEYNLRDWPEIDNLHALMIAQQKRNAVNHDLHEDWERLRKIQETKGYSADIQMKMDAYQCLRQKIQDSDKTITLSTILEEDSACMKTKVYDLLPGVSVPPGKRGVTIQEALYFKRFGLLPSTSETKLVALRNELTKKDLSLIDRLPYEMVVKIATELSLSDLSKLARTCKASQTLFQNPILTRKEEMLRECVIKADYDTLEGFVRIEPALMFEEIIITFPNGAQEKTTALEQAFKTYDTYMWQIFLRAIRHNPKLQSRFEEQLTKPIIHIDLAQLFSAYLTYIGKHQLRLANQITDDEFAKALLDLGKAQRLYFPWCMLRIFFDGTIAWSVRSSMFPAKDHSRPSDPCEVFVGDDGKKKTLDFDRCGEDFSLIHCLWTGVMAVGQEWGTQYLVGNLDLPVRDLAGLRYLLQVRTGEFNQLQLERVEQTLRQLDDDPFSCRLQ